MIPISFPSKGRAPNRKELPFFGERFVDSGIAEIDGIKEYELNNWILPRSGVVIMWYEPLQRGLFLYTGLDYSAPFQHRHAMKGVVPMFKKLQKQAGEVLEFPSDVLDNGPRIIIMGRSEMTVEYYHEVILFSNEEIILKTPVGKLSIRGKDFVLTTILETEIHLKGQISQVSFGEG